jgi:hypothetical protein
MARTWTLAQAGLMIDTIEKDVRRAAMAGLVSAGYRLVEHIVADVMPSFGHPPIDRSAYRAGWRVRKGPGYVVVENLTLQAAFIEHGVRPGNVKIGRKMIKALTAWVKRKGLGGRMVKGKDGRARHVKASSKEAEGIAWAIAKSFQKTGIFGPKGFQVLKKASRQAPRFMREEVQAKLRELGR